MGIPRQRAVAVAGHVGTLRQGVQREYAGLVITGDLRGERRHRPRIPSELQVALVGCDQRTVLTSGLNCRT